MSIPATVTLTAAGTSTAIALSPLVPGRAYGVAVTRTGTLGTSAVQTSVDDPAIYGTLAIYGTSGVPSNLQTVTSVNGDYGIIIGAYGALRLTQVGTGTTSLRVYQDGQTTS